MKNRQKQKKQKRIFQALSKSPEAIYNEEEKKKERVSGKKQKKGDCSKEEDKEK